MHLLVSAQKMSLHRSDPTLSPVQSCTPTLPGFTCGLDVTLRVIAGKWKPLILYFLAQDGPTRYGELRRAVRDVSDKMLIQQLKELEADGLVKRTDYKEVPPRVDYGLTPLGRSLAEASCRSAPGARKTCPRSLASSPSVRP
jgi:DNA-binding HxlR family transcriptional regulator